MANLHLFLAIKQLFLREMLPYVLVLSSIIISRVMVQLHTPLKSCKTTKNEKYSQGICDVTCQNQAFVTKMSSWVVILFKKNEFLAFIMLYCLFIYYD